MSDHPSNDSLGLLSWRGAAESGDRYHGRDPRDIAAQIKREAKRLRYGFKPHLKEAGVKGMHWGVHKPQDISGWKKVGEQKGTNPGGIYGYGTEFMYVKFPANKDQAKSEVLANSIYQTLGIPVPDSRLVEMDGKIGVGSPMIHGAETATKQEQIDSAELKKGFLADVLLANHDVVGLVHDNIIKTPSGAMVRIDNGGSMFFRAQGAPKYSYTGENIPELISMRDSAIAKQAGQVFKGVDLNSQEQQDQAARIKNILTDDKIKNLVSNAGFTGEEADKYEKVLADRRNLIGVIAQTGTPDEAQKAVDADMVKGVMQSHQFLSDEANNKALAAIQSDDDEKPTKGKTLKQTWIDKPVRPGRIGGYFLASKVAGKIYSSLEKANGQWIDLKSFEDEHTGKVKSATGRIQILKSIGKWTGKWDIEISGGQARMFINTGSQVKVQSAKDEAQLGKAESTAKQMIAMQDKPGAGDTKPVMSEYYKSQGVSETSLARLSTDVHDWGGSVNSKGGVAMRKIASEFYGRNYEGEHPSGIKTLMGKSDTANQASNLKDAFMANKAYASAHAREKGISVLYRGVHSEAADEVIKAINNGADVIKLPVNSLSSWSTKKDAADSFTHSSGIMLRMKVDPDNIWASKQSTPWLFHHSSEEEFIVGHKGTHESFKVEDVKVYSYGLAKDFDAKAKVKAK